MLVHSPVSRDRARKRSPFRRRAAFAAAITSFATAWLGQAATVRPAAPVAAGAIDPSPARRYIVMLADPPLAGYRGGIAGLAPTALDAGMERHRWMPLAMAPLGAAWRQARRTAHLDVDTPAARAYAAHLTAAQDRAIAALRAWAPGARVDWRYRYAFNGFAVKVTPTQAMRLMRLPGVAAVHAAEHLRPEMDSTLRLIHAAEAWRQAGGVEEAGLGVRIAIVDTGMDATHPFVNDEGMPPAPDGFPAATLHLRDGTVLDYPDRARYANGKLIAARTFPSPEMLEGLTPAQALARFTPFSGGHGMHVGGIAGGRRVTHLLPLAWGEVAPVTLSGVAPMAWLLNYKYDFSTGAEYAQGTNLAGTPELIAMLDQMIVDQVDVLNMSEGHVTFLIDHPASHPLAVAFDHAADAGIVPVFSAGNAGANGRVSLSGAFKHSAKVITVANTSTTASVDLTVRLSGAGAPAPELVVAPRGTLAVTTPITAPLFLAPDGGCAPDGRALGTIAVAVRNGEGACTYAERAEAQREAGAVAVLYYYDDRANGGLSTTPVALPAVAVGTAGGTTLVAWLRGAPPDAGATIVPGVTRGYGEVPDILAGSSSQGPSLDWGIKPDLAAPGTGVLSSFSSGTEAQSSPYFGTASGTSMSAPHVAGAAGLIRSAHPDWPAAMVRGTLINTSARTVRVAAPGAPPRDALPTEGGPGRLDLTRALDPGAFLAPPTVSFGKLGAGAPGARTVIVTSALPEAAEWSVEVQPLGGDGRVIVRPDRLTVTPTDVHVLSATLATDGLAESEHWGDIVLRQSGAERTLRLPYYAYVDTPARHKDVLLVNWTMGSTPDHGAFYTAALDAVGLTYDVWWVDEDPANAARGAVRAHPPFEVLQRYDLVVLNTNLSRVALQEAFAGSYQYFNHLLAGGNLLIAGQGPQGWWTVGQRQTQQGASQNAGCDMCLSRYMAGFQFGITATLTGRLLAWPERPAEPETTVVLQPHPGGGAPFAYALDISTGRLAKDGAAGNQYRFASGGLLGPYDPAREYPYTEGVFDRVRPWARPLWAYDGRVVGTYVAGRQHPEADIRWNAMYWGFGLEGVGGAGPGTADRARLLGDAFNFLARNLWIAGVREMVADAGLRQRLAFVWPPEARIPDIGSVEIDWGDGSAVETLTLAPPIAADRVTLQHTFPRPGAFNVRIAAIPVAGAAPLHGAVRVSVGRGGPSLWLPWASGGDGFAVRD